MNVPLKLLSPEALFSPKCTKYRLAAGLRPDPLDKLTALPQTPKLDLRVPTSKGRGGEGRGREGKGSGGETKEKSGKEGLRKGGGNMHHWL